MTDEKVGIIERLLLALFGKPPKRYKRMMIAFIIIILSVIYGLSYSWTFTSLEKYGLSCSKQVIDPKDFKKQK